MSLWRLLPCLVALPLAACSEPPSGEAETKIPSTTAKASELTVEALKHLGEDENTKAAELLDKALAQEPANRQALSLRAQLAYQQASEAGRPSGSPLFLRAAELMRKLRDGKTPLNPVEQQFLAQSLYKEASTYALEGEKTKAMKSLSDAAATGYQQADEIESDHEIDLLRALPEFKDLEKKILNKAIAIAELHAKDALDNGKPFPFRFQLPDVNGKTVSLADFKGKVALVDFWGTWCGPCRKEIPHFIELFKRYHEKGLEIVGINYEREDDQTRAAAAIKAFVDQKKIPYPCLIGDEKTKEQIPPRLEGYPTTLFIDRAGKVRLKVVGYHSLIDLDAIVRKLLDEGSTEALETSRARIEQ